MPLSPPVVTTGGSTLVTASSATLSALGNPGGAAATGWFRYSTANPGFASDSFGTRAPTSSFSDPALGSGTSAVEYSQAITGLLPGTTYYYAALAENAAGTGLGGLSFFTTLAAPPTVSTGSASNRTGTSATLNASANPGGGASTGWFRISTTSPGAANDSFCTRFPASGGTALGAGTSSVGFSQGATGLTPGTTYYYAAIASNSAGTSFGTIQSFTTPLPPTVITGNASSIEATKVTLNATGNPSGATTTGWFRYSSTHPGVANDSAGIRAPGSGGSALGAGLTDQPFAQVITGLSPSSTYFFWALDSSAEGTAYGTIKSFTTAAP